MSDVSYTRVIHLCIARKQGIMTRLGGGRLFYFWEGGFEVNIQGGVFTYVYVCLDGNDTTKKKEEG